MKSYVKMTNDGKDKIISIIENEFATTRPEVRAAKKLYKAGYRTKDLRGININLGMVIRVLWALRDIENKKAPKPKGKPGAPKGHRKVSKEKQEEIIWFCENTKNELWRLVKRFNVSEATIAKIRDGKY